MAYDFSYPKRGEALVIGNVHFDAPGVGCLKGVNQDTKNFTDTFKLLGFNVTVKKNLTEQEMREAIQECECNLQVEVYILCQEEGAYEYNFFFFY